MDEFTIKGINGLLNFLDSLTSAVLWVRNEAYDKQLYVSTNIEKIWTTSPDTFYQTPDVWQEFLIPEDAPSALGQTSVRKNKFAADNSVVFYRIKDSQGQIRYIKDTCFALMDQHNRFIAHAGVAEELSVTLWQEQVQSNTAETLMSPLQQQLISIVETELGVTPCNALQHKSHKKWVNTTVQSIPTLFGNLEVTKREAQCLYYLGQGLSAKETAKVLNLSPRTIETYLDTLRQKTQAKSKLELLSKLDWQLIQID